MAYKLVYDKSMIGARITAEKDGAAINDGIFEHGTVYNVRKGTMYILTGCGYYDGTTRFYVQTTDGLYIYIDTYEETQNDWTITENYKTIPTYSDNQAQKLIDKIIDNNKIILRRNLLCARYANKLSKKQREQVRQLQLRLQARNSALQVDGLTKDVQTSYPAEYAELSAYMDKLMTSDAVGIASWVIIVIAAAVIAGLGTAAYYTYKKLADESEADLKYSKELTATLVSKLTEEEYQQLLNETKGMLTKAKIKQLVRGDAKWLLFVGVGLFAWYYISKWRNA